MVKELLTQGAITLQTFLIPDKVEKGNPLMVVRRQCDHKWVDDQDCKSDTVPDSQGEITTGRTCQCKEDYCNREDGVESPWLSNLGTTQFPTYTAHTNGSKGDSGSGVPHTVSSTSCIVFSLIQLLTWS